MWKILNIFDGDYGCEELMEGESPKVTVTLEDENSNRKCIRVRDDLLYERKLDEGSTFEDLAYLTES